MKKLMILLARIFNIKPRRLINIFRGIPFFFTDLARYVKETPIKGRFEIKISDLYPIYNDRYDTAGVANGHYFHQDLWAAKRIYSANPYLHIDVGSRIDGFISHLLVFREVTVIDVRILKSEIPGLTFVQGDITSLYFDDNSLESVSCLHAIEHIGLGRYGDKIDYDGWQKGLKELGRVLKPGGVLYLGIPIGRERVCFNAHRVFSPKTILDTLSELSLISFSYIDDNGDLISQSQDLEIPTQLEYGCGLFEFSKI